MRNDLRGAYGMVFPKGLGAGHPALPSAEPDWEPWTIAWHALDKPRVNRGIKLGAIEGGRVDLDLKRREAILITREPPTSSALLHPWLSYVATVVSHFRGFDSFHAGGVVVNGRVWAVLGSKHSGKTTTLGWFASNGFPVTSDDLVVINGARVLAGPGCLDLREGAAAQFGVTSSEEILPGRVRWRMWLPAPPASAPLAGFVLLGWGNELQVGTVSAGERLHRLVEQRAALVPKGQERRMIELCGLPMVRWTRPADLEALTEAGETLAEELRRR